MTMQDPIDYCKKNCQSNYQYKNLVTGGNDPSISCKMRYANLVNNTQNLNRASGSTTQATCSTVKNIYTSNGLLIGKLICFSNGN